jgi:predicted MFS family arabinose efflux permease
MKKWTYEATLAALLMLGFGVAFIDRSRSAVLMPMIARDFKPSYAEAGLAIGIVGLTWGIFDIIGGSLSDRFGRKSVLVPSVLVFSATSWIAGLARNIRELTVMRGFMGAGEGTYLASSSAWMSEEAKPERRGLDIGIIYLGASLFGSALGPIVITWMATENVYGTGWRFPFFAFASIGFLMAAIIYAFTHEPPSVLESRRAAATRDKPNTPSSSSRKLVEVLKHRNMIVCMILAIVYMPVQFMHMMYGPLYMDAVRHWDIITIGQVMSFLGVGGAIGMAGGGRLSDYIGRKITVVTSFALSAVCGYWFFFLANTPLMAVLASFLLGVCAFPIPTCVFGTIPVETVGFKHGAFASGLSNGMGEIFGAFLLSSSAGALADTYGIQVVGYVLVISAVVGLITSLFLKETAPRVVARKRAS